MSGSLEPLKNAGLVALIGVGADGQVATYQADGTLAFEAIPEAGLVYFAESRSTTAPNNLVYVDQLTALGESTNVDVAIAPKGSGALIAGPSPDGTATGGNKRGSCAVDLQLLRNAATQVASGADSTIAGGKLNIASGDQSTVSGGEQNTASSQRSTVGGGWVNSASNAFSCVTGGRNNLSSGNTSWVGGCHGNTAANSYTAVAGGLSNTASALGAAVLGGQYALADRYSMQAHAAGRFAVNGDAQHIRFVARNKTTSATPAELFLDGSATRLTIPTGKLLFADVLVSGIKSDGSAAATYRRKVAIKNVGGTTSLVGSVETIGTDHEDAATALVIAADNANDALTITVTGIAAETWRWVAVIEGLEIGYGT